MFLEYPLDALNAAFCDSFDVLLEFTHFGYEESVSPRNAVAGGTDDPRARAYQPCMSGGGTH